MTAAPKQQEAAGDREGSHGDIVGNAALDVLRTDERVVAVLIVSSVVTAKSMKRAIST